jgi:hypothetical protein
MMPTLTVLHDAHAVLDIIRFDALEPGPQPLTIARVMREALLDKNSVLDAITYLVETGRISKEQVAQ